jgi:hypothetical protein
MPVFFYTVTLGINKSSPKKGWLVELLCTQHRQAPEMSACDVAESAVRQHFGAEAIVGYRDSNEYSSPLPKNLGRAHFIALVVVALGFCRFDIPDSRLFAVTVSLDFSQHGKRKKCSLTGSISTSPAKSSFAILATVTGSGSGSLIGPCKPSNQNNRSRGVLFG